MVIMKRAWLFGVGAGAFAAAALGCNGLLGIGAASLEAEDGGVGEAATRTLSCAYYCSTINQNCAQANAEYQGTEDPVAVCNTICPAFDVGTSIAPTDDDTLGCRIYYAEQAATDAGAMCRFAGPLGGGRCGTDPCELFCSVDIQYCNNAPVSTPAYASSSDCLSACTGKGGDAGADAGGYPYLTTGPDLLDSTNTLNCRFWHMENAYGSLTAGQYHCPHTELASQVCN
jgi:hypothetical protein